ncbi:MAG: electron transport complex subunit E [Pseudomonadota bacterium]
MTGSLKQQLKNGLWADNPGLVQLLGLCPLLAVTTSFANGLGLGLATLLVLTASNVLVSASRRWLIREIRVPVYVLIIASLVTSVELLFEAWFPALDRSLGIFIPLIVTNCAIVARAEVFASRNAVWPSLLDGLAMGAGFALLLTGIGAFRELLGQGTLFADLGMLAGLDSSTGLRFFEEGFLLAVLPPGAFFSLALAIALKNTIDLRRRRAHGVRRANPQPR